MKLFSIKIAKITTLIILTLLLINISALYLVKKTSFQFSRDKKIVIIGDSHTECAINDKLLPMSVNVSKSADAFLFSYIKLNKILESNDQIRVVLLSFHADSLSKKTDKWIFDAEYILGRVTPYLPFFSYREYKLVVFPNIVAIAHNSSQQNLKLLVTYLFKKKIGLNDLNFGKFNDNNRHALALDMHRKANRTDNNYISVCQLEYLGKIIHLCKKKNIRLILLNTSLYKQKYGKDILYLYELLLEKFKHIEFIDDSLFDIPKEGFGDITHLNSSGAKIYTKHLEKVLEDLNVY